jgi:hypothetical protein
LAWSTSHFAQRSGVKTAPIGLTGKGEFCITAALKTLDCLNSLLRVSADTLVVFYGEVGEDVVKGFGSSGSRVGGFCFGKWFRGPIGRRNIIFGRRANRLRLSDA